MKILLNIPFILSDEQLRQYPVPVFQRIAFNVNKYSTSCVYNFKIENRLLHKFVQPSLKRPKFNCFVCLFVHAVRWRRYWYTPMEPICSFDLHKCFENPCAKNWVCYLAKFTLPKQTRAMRFFYKRVKGLSIKFQNWYGYSYECWI